MNFHVGLERSFKLCASRRSQNEDFLPSFENLNCMFLLSESSWPDENKFLYFLIQKVGNNFSK